MSRLLQVVAVGRLRPPLLDAGREYEARVARLVAFRADEVPAEVGVRSAGDAMRREGARVRERVAPGAHRVALQAGAPAPRSSETFAEWLGRRLEAPRPTAFLIGGASGLDPGLAGEADERLSLGPLTLPHQLARVVLVEQVYRALLALAGHPYPR